MNLSYDQMASWIDVYFADFNTYGQDPAEIHRMDEYFSKDFVFNPYIAYVGKVTGRDDWYKVLTSHPSGIEVLTPEHVVIDERKQEFVARIKTDLVDRDTNQVLLTKRYLARYPLVEEDGTMKIARLEFFWEILPEGALEIDDVFERDWGKGEPGMSLTHDQIVQWMKDYFAAYNLYAQDAATVHRMDAYFAPDLKFMPYMYVFGGPENAITNSEDFYAMLTGHPDDYEQFEVLDVFVDAERMVAVAFLLARIYATADDTLLVQKHYLPLYELALDAEGSLKIKTIRFFWEASPPEVDAHYSGAGKGN